MPIYVYQCGGCQYKLEVLQKITDDPLKNCPQCGEDSLRKMVTAAAFKLKGTGWYETDFKDKKQQKPEDKSDAGNETGSKTSTAAEKTTAADTKQSKSDAAVRANPTPD